MSSLTDPIAITGISGRYPNCLNIEELKEALLEGKDLLSEDHDRWPHEVWGTSSRLGTILDAEYFDASFFGMNPKEAHGKDLRSRKILEVVFEALVDAGLNPTEIRGSNTGVFMAMGANNCSDLGRKLAFAEVAYALMVNTVSFAFDLKGPSFALDAECASGLYILTQAADAIMNERCDKAIICAAQYVYDPAECMEFLKMGTMGTDGHCRSFDLNRNGYVKSDALVAIILEKVKDSRRIYATIAGSGINCDGYSERGIIRPQNSMQRSVFEDTFDRYNIDSSEVVYIEGHGIGTKDGDVGEVEAIDEYFCKNRKDPLLLGSVKSNLGHSEIASGLVSLTKIIIAIHEGIIPANLHYKTCDPSMKGIYEGRIKVVHKNTSLPKGLIAVTGSGIGGANAAAVLKPFTEKRIVVNNLKQRLVCVSGRTEKGVKHMIHRIIEYRKNNEFLSLIDNIFSKPIQNHDYRGFITLSDDSKYEINKYSSKKHPIWFIFAGMGSQWPGMGKDLMQIEVFRKTFRKCAEAVKPFGLDLEEIVTNTTDAIFHNITYSMVAIVAVSVCLTDLLRSYGIEPEGIFGHSIGEVSCAYADGVITAEQATTIAYYRGHAAAISEMPPGLMATVGLSVEECEKILPEGVVIACDNADTNVTISGPAETVKKFTEKLAAKEIFNKTVASSNMAFHSPLLADSARRLRELLKNVLTEKKMRTKRWLPTAVPESEWDSELGRYHSLEYQMKNYTNRVHFKQIFKHVPKDAILIEVAPRGLLQAILKRGVDKSVTLVSLQRPGTDNFEFFLSSLGKIYNAGGQLNLKAVYPPVSFPVSIDTPTISNLIKWDHSVKWEISRYNPFANFGERVEIDMSDQSNQFLEGHNIDGKITFPAAGFLFYTWRTFSRMLGIPQFKLPVIFENVKTLRMIFLPKDDVTVLILNIFRSSGDFEIFLENESMPFCTGKISVASEFERNLFDYSNIPSLDKYKLKLNCDDFYKALHLKGFGYGGLFLGVEECDLDGTSAKLKWNDNWIPFIDSALHVVMGTNSKGLVLPIAFEKIIIDPEEHSKLIDSNNDVLLTHNQYAKAFKCGGLQMVNYQCIDVKIRVNDPPPTIKKYTFVPMESEKKHQGKLDALSYCLSVVSQILVENSAENLNMKFGEIDSNNATGVLKTVMEKFSIKRTTFQQIESKSETYDDYFDLLLTENIDSEKEEYIRNYLKCSKFIFSSIQNYDSNFFKLHNLQIIFKHVTSDGTYILFRETQPLPEHYSIVLANNNQYNWIEDLKSAIKKNQSPTSRIYLVNEDYNSGIVGFINSVREEQTCPNLRVFLIRNGEKMEPFSIRSHFYAEQLKKDLTINVYHNDSWGTYRLLPLELPEEKLFKDAYLLNVFAGRNAGLKWAQKTPYEKDSTVSVHFAAINHWDILTANGKVNIDIDDECLGLEYSGIDENGNNVMGLVPKGALSTSVRPHPKLTWSVPYKWSLEQAATVPLAYALSYYSLFIRIQVKPNDYVLIHNGTNNLSLAAIALTSHNGSIVYVVVNSQNQKNALKSFFPMIQEDNIVVDTEVNPFYETVLKNTKGRGVDVVFNCISLDVLGLSLKCATKTTSFIEIGHIEGDLLENKLPFTNVTVTDLFQEGDEILDEIATNIENYLINGVVVPFNYTLFDKGDIGATFKKVENTGYSEKYLVKIKSKDDFSESENQIMAVPRTYLDPSKCYIIVGGLGGFGLELTKWMINRGATKIILNSRREVYSGYQAFCLKKWQSQGVNVLTDISDTTTLDGAECLLNYASNLAPVGGIFNSTLLLKDEIITNQTPDNFVATVAPKLFSAQNMDFLSRKLPYKLDYFVMFSSLVSSLGNASQTSYGFANSAMERLCESRRAEGLHALAVEWGPIGDVGFVARLKTNVRFLDALPQKIRSCLDALDGFLQLLEPVVYSAVYVDEDDVVSDKRTPIESVAALFGIKDVSSIDDSKTLLNLGIDSVLAFEVKHMLAKQYGVDIGVDNIRNLTVEMVKNMGNNDN